MPATRPARPATAAGPAPAKPEPVILFQKYFKSVGPRTYAAQVKEAGNGNHFLVLTEGKRDDKTAEVRKTRLFVYSEDFVEFFKMLHETAQLIKTHPLPDEVKKRRARYWTRKNEEQNTDSPAAPAPPSPRPAPATSPRPAPRRAPKSS